MISADVLLRPLIMRHVKIPENIRKMNVAVILAHPYRKSFNHAIAQTAVRQLERNGHVVFLHDLYAENFNPIFTQEELRKDAFLPEAVGVHCREIAEAEGIIIVHPNWWGQPSAILKGWIDRVVRPGVAYEFLEGDSGEGIPNGLLKAKAAVVFNTSNTPQDLESLRCKDAMGNLWKVCVLDTCGVTKVERRLYSPMISSTQQQREGWLKEAAETIKKQFTT